MQEPTESKEKKDWLDRFIEHGLLFFVAQIFGMAEIVSVDDPSVKGETVEHFVVGRYGRFDM